MNDNLSQVPHSLSMIVVKVGGTEGVDYSSICEDAANLITRGFRVVIVHGGSAEANGLGEALGYPPRFITSPSGYTSRYTDRHTLEIFSMAVNGKVNTFFVAQLQSLGVNALGMSGLDGRLIEATRIVDRQQIARALEKIESNRLQDRTRFGESLVSLASLQDKRVLGDAEPN